MTKRIPLFSDEPLPDPRPLDPPETEDVDYEHLFKCVRRKLTDAGIDANDINFMDWCDLEPDDEGQWWIPVEIRLNLGEF